MTDGYRVHPFYQAKADADRLEQERLAQAFARAMLRESLRDGWIMGEHPVRHLRGNDHD
jgi:hypothetical protein